MLKPEAPDLWPRTSRPLPWLLALFLATLFLIPIGGVRLDVPLPVDPYFDRVVLAVVLFVWVLVAWLGPQRRLRVERPALFLGATVVFVSLALLSLVTNVPEIVSRDLLGLSQNRLALLLAYVSFGWFAVSAMRPGELGNFSLLFVGLASLVAVGVIWERRTGYNVFYELIGQMFAPVADVTDSPTEIHPELLPLQADRKVIVGPTEHGLAVTTMLVMAVPFAIVAFLQTHTPRRWVYALAIALILGAALSTERKTAVLTPLVAVLVITAYRPRDALRMIPLGVVLFGVIHVVSPGALGTIGQLESGADSSSTAGRSSDYTAISPDFLAHPLLGAGYGTRDIAKVDEVRLLDNEYLGQLLSVGLIGTLAFIAMILSAMVVAHRAIRSGDPTRAGPALAASASCAVFVLACTLFDSMSFPQVPYAFFFVAAVATAAAARELPEPVASKRRTAGPPLGVWMRPETGHRAG